MSLLSDRLQEADVVDLPDWQAAAVLTAPDPAYPIRRDVLTADIANYLARQQVVGKLRGLRSHETEQVRELGEAVSFVLDGRWDAVMCSIPENDAAFRAQIGALVALGILSQTQADEIDAMADGCQSWAAANGVEVTARTVGLARGGI